MLTDKNPAGHGALTVAYIIFGLNNPTMKSILSDGTVSALALAFFRVAGAASLFWIVSIFAHKEKVSRHDLVLLIGASMTGIFFNQFSFAIGLSKTSPIDASVITTISPILTMLLAALFLKEPITWQKAAGVFIGASGALLLILNNNAATRGGSSFAGIMLCILSSLSFVIYLTVFKNLIMRYKALTLMKWMFLYSTIFSLPFCWRDINIIDYKTLPVKTWFEIIYVVVFATFISYFLIPVGQKYLRPTIVSMYNYVQPVVSSIVAVVIGMDIFGWKKALAALLVFLGVYIVTQSKSRAQMEAERIKQSK